MLIVEGGTSHSCGLVVEWPCAAGGLGVRVGWSVCGSISLVLS